MKMKSYLLDNPTVMAMKKALVTAGLDVDHDTQALTIVVYHGETEVFRGIRKGYGQPWIVRHVEDLFQ